MLEFSPGFFFILLFAVGFFVHLFGLVLVLVGFFVGLFVVGVLGFVVFFTVDKFFIIEVNISKGLPEAETSAKNDKLPNMS